MNDAKEVEAISVYLQQQLFPYLLHVSIDFISEFFLSLFKSCMHGLEGPPHGLKTLLFVFIQLDEHSFRVLDFFT